MSRRTCCARAVIAMFLGAGMAVASVVIACNGEVAEPSPPPSAGDGSLNLDSPLTGDETGSVRDGGSDVLDIPEDDGGKPIPPGLVCSSNAHCNAGGVCFEGICVCNDPLRIQPDGRCGAFPEPACGDQADAGATCRSPTGRCMAGELYGTGEANFSCGDFAPSACCFSGCKGPATPFFCCRPDPKGAIDQICSQGWKTCPHGWRAVADAAACDL